MATNWLRTGAASSSSNVGDQGEGGVKRSATGEKVVPNVEALVDVGGMRGEEKPVVEGLEDQMEAVLLRLLSKHGHLLRAAESAESTGAPTTSSSTSKMVEQGCQTELVGDVIPVSKRARNKVSFAAESGDLLTGEAEETAPVAATKSSILVVGDAEGVVPVAMVMSEGEILELEAARIQQESDEDLYADGGGKVSQAADLPIIDCDGKTWERHFHEDGREYRYCLDTGETQWVLPKKTGMAGNSEGSGVGMGIVPVEEEPALGTTSSSSPTESFRAQQGSMESVNSGVNSVGEKDFPLLSGIAVLGLVVTPRPRVLLMKRGFLETEQTSLKLNIWIGKRWRRFLRVWQRWNRWVQKKKCPMWRSELCRLQKSEWWMWCLSFRKMALEIWMTKGKSCALRLRRSLRLVPRILPFKGKRKLLKLLETRLIGKMRPGAPMKRGSTRAR